MITRDLQYGAEEGCIRYGASNSYYTPANNIYDILDVVSGSVFSYGAPTFAYQGSSKPFVVKFRDMQVGDNIRFVFYANGFPITSSSKLPVLSMTINGEEILLPSKIPQIEGSMYSAYVDYQVMQNINNIEISLFVRDNISSNGTTILQEPPNVCTQGLEYIDVKRADTEPPTFNTINLSNITSNSFSLNIHCNENATAYYKLLNRGGTAPTSEELKTTHDAEIVLTENVLSTINTAGLFPNTDYDLYVVAEDSVGNLQINPTKISFSTIADKITDLDFNIDFDLTHPADTINIKYTDIKSNGVSILDKNPIIKYWTDNNPVIKTFSENGESFSKTTKLYFQVEYGGNEKSNIFTKQLNIIYINGFQNGYNGGLVDYHNHKNDNYKKSSSMILVPLSRNSFISPK